MGKGKKKHSKKADVADDLLDVAALSIKKFRKVTHEIGKLSTGQKVVGGIALLAAGLTYLAKTESENSTATDKNPVTKLLGGGSSASPADHQADALAKAPKSPPKTRKAPRAE